MHALMEGQQTSRNLSDQHKYSQIISRTFVSFLVVCLHTKSHTDLFQNLEQHKVLEQLQLHRTIGKLSNVYAIADDNKSTFGFQYARGRIALTKSLS